VLKYLLYPVELLAGLSYATHRFMSRCDVPLDPKTVWNRAAEPRSRVIRFLEGCFPRPFLIFIVLKLLQMRTVFRSPSIGIEEHYDLSNEFFKLFLDKRYLFYSYGDFHSDSDSLEDAQENKANYILNLIDPKPGQTILDLGCGWGSMMKKIIQETKDKDNVVGYTLSNEQADYVRQMGYQVELQDVMTADFGKNQYDRIYSIGLMEHIRNHELLPLSQKLEQALRPGGRIVHQFFCQKGKIPTADMILFMDIFPGSFLDSFNRHQRVFEEAGLRITHHSIHDYRPTLRAWFNRLAENKDRAIELIGVRNYNRHLSYFAFAYRMFDSGSIIPNRFVLEAPQD